MSSLSSHNPGDIIMILASPGAGSHIAAARTEAMTAGVPYFLFNDKVYETKTMKVVLRVTNDSH